ncbi:MAG: hypothetical protein QF718_03920 [Phycisphaerales bacterium]|jgi:hypothetical protein|nr:hypothetical protein [Phycisphaerales bacterium]
MNNLLTGLVIGTLSSSAFATTWTVDDDGKADFDNIQAAIDYASNGDEIIVMPGTYTGTGDSVINTLGKQLWIHSSDSYEKTIIDGELLRRGIECSTDETSGTIIEGITITQGRLADSPGGGLYCKNAFPSFINCSFENNAAGTNGGGAHCVNGGASFTACKFSSNSATRGGGVNTFRSAVTFTECLFEDNQSSTYGGCMYSYGNSSSGDPLRLLNCMIKNNTADSGGGLYLNSASNVITDCAIVGNTAYQAGGGMFNNQSSNPMITNCAFRFNESIADSGGGIRSVSGSSPGISDTQFCSNFHNGGHIGGNIVGNYVDLGGNDFLQECPDCPGDVDDSGVVDVNDIIAIIIVWNCTDCDAEDINGNGVVEVNDLIELVSNWGPCE